MGCDIFRRFLGQSGEWTKITKEATKLQCFKLDHGQTMTQKYEINMSKWKTDGNSLLVWDLMDNESFIDVLPNLHF